MVSEVERTLIISVPPKTSGSLCRAEGIYSVVTTLVLPAKKLTARPVYWLPTISPKVPGYLDRNPEEPEEISSTVKEPASSDDVIVEKSQFNARVSNCGT